MSVLHTHPSNQNAIDTQKVKLQLKADAETTKTRPKQLLADTVSAADPAVRVNIANNESVKRNIRRHRRGGLPKEPAAVQVILNFIIGSCFKSILLIKL